MTGEYLAERPLVLKTLKEPFQLVEIAREWIKEAVETIAAFEIKKVLGNLSWENQLMINQHQPSLAHPRVEYLMEIGGQTILVRDEKEWNFKGIKEILEICQKRKISVAGISSPAKWIAKAVLAWDFHLLQTSAGPVSACQGLGVVLKASPNPMIGYSLMLRDESFPPPLHLQPIIEDWLPGVTPKLAKRHIVTAFQQRFRR